MLARASWCPWWMLPDKKCSEFAVPDTYRIPAMTARTPRTAKTAASACLLRESPNMAQACPRNPCLAPDRQDMTTTNGQLNWARLSTRSASPA
jgi:hypothetical protein